MLDFIKSDRKFALLLKIRFTEKETQNAIDFSKMQQKSYQTGRQFEDDVKWFVHHCQSIYQQQEEIKNASVVLMNNVATGIRTIDVCTECYDNLYDFYVMSSVPKPCSKLHLLIWIKEEMYGFFWPVKVLAANDDNKSICVQSFGDYACWDSRVTENNCYLYSEKIPEKKGGGRPKFFTSAIKEATDYIANIRSKFGNCNYAKPHIAFEFGKMQEYLQQMVATAPSNYYYTSENEKRNDDSSRKRSSNDGHTESKSAKRARSGKPTNPIENALRLAQRYVGDKDEKIEKLEKDLDNAKKSLQQSSTMFAVERKGLEDDKKALTKKIESLEMELRNQRTTFVEVKKTLTDMNMALVSAKDKEKKELEEKNKAIMAENATLKKELDEEKEKFAEGKKYLERALDYLKKIQ